jgi:hypothetical protein
MFKKYYERIYIMKKIIIIGTRNRDTQEDYKSVYNEFKKWYNKGDIIVSGGCKKGGDRFAEIIAKKLSIPIIIHYPILPESGSPKWAYAKVNYERNTVVANEAEENTVTIACVALNRKGGTEDTIKKIQRKGFDGNLIRII